MGKGRSPETKHYIENGVRREKTLRLPSSYFDDSVGLVIALDNYNLDDYTMKLKSDLEDFIIAKGDAINRHNSYISSKSTRGQLENSSSQQEGSLKMRENIQVPIQFFTTSVALLSSLDGCDLDSDTSSYKKNLDKMVDSKIDSMSRHNLYTTYKTAETDTEKEKARQSYLDSVGMHKDWRY